MTGPNPKKVIGMYRKVVDPEDRILKCLANVPSPQREQLGECILRVWVQYQEQLSALRQSSTRAEILAAVDEKHRQIGTIVLWLSNPLPVQILNSASGDTGERNYQFHSALGDILELRGYSLQAFRAASEQALEAVRALDMIATELHSVIERSLDDAVFVAESAKTFRERLFRSLHRVLVRGGVKDGVGASSTLTLLVMELEPNPLRSGEKDAMYRKGLARLIKAAVNDHEANEFGSTFEAHSPLT